MDQATDVTGDSVLELLRRLQLQLPADSPDELGLDGDAVMQHAYSSSPHSIHSPSELLQAWQNQARQDPDKHRLQAQDHAHGRHGAAHSYGTQQKRSPQQVLESTAGSKLVALIKHQRHQLCAQEQRLHRQAQVISSLDRALLEHRAGVGALVPSLGVPTRPAGHSGCQAPLPLSQQHQRQGPPGQAARAQPAKTLAEEGGQGMEQAHGQGQGFTRPVGVRQVALQQRVTELERLLKESRAAEQLAKQRQAVAMEAARSAARTCPVVQPQPRHTRHTAAGTGVEREALVQRLHNLQNFLQQERQAREAACTRLGEEQGRSATLASQVEAAQRQVEELKALAQEACQLARKHEGKADKLKRTRAQLRDARHECEQLAQQVASLTRVLEDAYAGGKFKWEPQELAIADSAPDALGQQQQDQLEQQGKEDLTQGQRQDQGEQTEGSTQDDRDASEGGNGRLPWGMLAWGNLETASRVKAGAWRRGQGGMAGGEVGSRWGAASSLDGGGVDRSERRAGDPGGAGRGVRSGSHRADLGSGGGSEADTEEHGSGRDRSPTQGLRATQLPASRTFGGGGMSGAGAWGAAVSSWGEAGHARLAAAGVPRGLRELGRGRLGASRQSSSDCDREEDGASQEEEEGGSEQEGGTQAEAAVRLAQRLEALIGRPEAGGDPREGMAGARHRLLRKGSRLKGAKTAGRRGLLGGGGHEGRRGSTLGDQGIAMVGRGSQSRQALPLGSSAVTRGQGRGSEFRRRVEHGVGLSVRDLEAGEDRGDSSEGASSGCRSSDQSGDSGTAARLARAGPRRASLVGLQPLHDVTKIAPAQGVGSEPGTGGGSGVSMTTELLTNGACKSDLRDSESSPCEGQPPLPWGLGRPTRAGRRSRARLRASQGQETPVGTEVFTDSCPGWGSSGETDH